MKKVKIIINILLVISFMAIIIVSAYLNGNKENFYKMEINTMVLSILTVANLLLLIIYNIKKENGLKMNILIIAFFIFLFCFPIYKTGNIYAPIKQYNGKDENVIQTYYSNIYGITIYITNK